MTGSAARLVLISGSLRTASTNSAALRTLERLTAPGVSVGRYEGMGRLPHFNPDDDIDPLHPEVAGLRAAIHSASALVFSTPEYAGALPGSFKNLLDWTIGDDQPGSIYDKPVAWINTSPRGAHGAYNELRAVLEYAHAAIMEEACVAIPITGAIVGPDGLVNDPTARNGLAQAARTLIGAVTSGQPSR